MTYNINHYKKKNNITILLSTLEKISRFQCYLAMDKSRSVDNPNVAQWLRYSKLKVQILILRFDIVLLKYFKSFFYMEKQVDSDQ